MDEVIVVGAGIGGLTLGIALHQAGIPCRIFESAAELRAVGVGISLLPHATRELAGLGLEDALECVAIKTADAAFFNRFGQLIDFMGAFIDWRFDWLDVPAFIRAADSVLEFPMVDQDPLPRWSFGRVTLLGDAAHPMVPRGSNGAGQAILDVRALTTALRENPDPVAVLAAYEAQRREATARVVLTNRSNPPDAILREVFQRTHDRPFSNIDDVSSRAELLAMSDGYKQIAGYSREGLLKSS